MAKTTKKAVKKTAKRRPLIMKLESTAGVDSTVRAVNSTIGIIAAKLTAAGNRNNSSKPRLSLVLEASHALEGAARVLEDGILEYGRANWRKGLVHSEVVDSLLRHLTRYMAGETNDLKSGRPHADHILCNAIFLAELQRTHPDLDDRPVVEGEHK